MTIDEQKPLRTSAFGSWWDRRRNSPIRVRWNPHTFSLAGIVMAMGYAGAVQNNGAAYLLCFLTIVLAAMSWLRARENLRGLEIIAGRIENAREGESSKLPLEIRATAGQTVCGVEILTAGSKRWSFIEQVESGSSVRLTLPLPAAEVGVQDSFHVRLRSAYPLGLFNAERDVEIRHTRKIHPRSEGSLALPAADPALAASSLAVTQKGGQPGREGDDFAGMREWQPGDSLRHVDWRAVARGRPLLVKQWSSGAGSAVTLEWEKLDLPNAQRASQMARWIEHCEAANTPYALRLPHAEIPVNLGSTHVQQCLDALSEVAENTSTEAQVGKRAKRLPAGHEHSTHLPQGLLLALCGMLALVVVPLLDFASSLTLMLLLACIFTRLLFKRALLKWVPLIVLVLGALMIQFVQPSGLVSMEGGIAVLIVLLGAKLLESRTPHDFQVLAMVGWFLCLCGLLSEQSLSRAMWTLAVFAGISVCMVRFRRGSLDFMTPLRLTGTMLAQALPVAVLLFFIFPRGSLEFLSRFGTQRMHLTGVSDSMEPGSLSKIALSNTTAFRAEFPNSAPPPNQSRYWRCVVLWDGDGLNWKKGGTWEGDREVRLPRSTDVLQRITLEPHGRTWLPSLDIPAVARDDGRTVLPDMDDLLISSEPVNSLRRYDAVSRLTQDSMKITAEQRRAALRLSPKLSTRIIELARQLQKDSKTDTQIALAAVDYLRAQGFQYTLEPGTYLGPNALDEFLFERRIGFCEHFSAAFATLMRAAGVPSRVVIGYMGGEWSPRGGYMIVRQSEAHAWTELWLADKGWTRVDPTAALVPGRMDLDLRSLLADEGELERQRNSFLWRGTQELRLWWDGVEYDWYNSVISFDEESQIAWLNWLGLGRLRGRTLLVVSGLVFILSLAALTYWLRRPARHRDPWARAWVRLCLKLERQGIPARLANEGPFNYAKRVSAARPSLATEIQHLAQSYANARYGQDGGDLSAFEKTIQKLP